MPKTTPQSARFAAAAKSKDGGKGVRASSPKGKGKKVARSKAPTPTEVLLSEAEAAQEDTRRVHTEPLPSNRGWQIVCDFCTTRTEVKTPDEALQVRRVHEAHVAPKQKPS